MTDWNDDRLDSRDQELRDSFTKVDERFDQVDERFKEVDRENKAGFARVDERLAKTPTREEMNDSFAALRSEMNEGFAELRSAYRTLNGILLVGAFGIIGALLGFHG